MRVRLVEEGFRTDQAGVARSALWRVEPVRAAARTVEPLMGWLSAPDATTTLTGRLTFAALDDALAFVAAQGWESEIVARGSRVMRPRSFADNFRVTTPDDEERFARDAQRA
jgi:hypothetical protein